MSSAPDPVAASHPGSPPPSEPRTIVARFERDPEGRPKHFTLSLGRELITLNPGKTWLKADEYKWVTRGLIEAPQSFHVESNGTVDINGEKIALSDHDALARLEHEINKHHLATTPRKSAATTGTTAKTTPVSRVPHYKVKLDHFGHLALECTRGTERFETGLRGLNSLVHSGLMIAPRKVHVDPLHRGLELDGVFYEANEAGARLLETALNTRYIPTTNEEEDTAIEIKDNPAAATGFDIHFVTVLSGARFEVKGHLSQEKLDLLQDQAKCDLLRPGVMLRLSPPNLLFRRRRPDGGEEHIPELPDLQYRRVTALQLQHLLNHPIIRRTGDSTAAALHPEQHPAELAELRVVRNPQNKALLWLECLTTAGGPPEGKAFTHHNLADLMEAGVFLPHLDVTLSLDHRTLGILNKETRHEEQFIIESTSPDADLAQVSRMLTAALKPPKPRPAAVPPPKSSPVPPPPPLSPPAPVSSPAPAPAPAPEPPLSLPPQAAIEPQSQPLPPATPPPLPTAPPLPEPPPPSPAATGRPDSPIPAATLPPPPPPANAPGPAPGAARTPPPRLGSDPAARGPFTETSALVVNLSIFDSLVAHLNVPAQDILLTLPRAFEDRRFQILSFSHPEIQTILDLRSEEFYGFYLSHVSEQKILLVYACRGRHLEFGPERCLLQAAVTAEPNEFKASGLLGLAQDPESNFVFVVTPAYRHWVTAFERPYLDVCARFLTPQEIAAAPDQFTLIWPE